MNPLIGSFADFFPSNNFCSKFLFKYYIQILNEKCNKNIGSPALFGFYSPLYNMYFFIKTEKSLIA